MIVILKRLKESTEKSTNTTESNTKEEEDFSSLREKWLKEKDKVDRLYLL